MKEQPILASDPKAVEKLKAKIAELEKLQAVMSGVNKAMRSARKAGPQAQVEAMVKVLVEYGMEAERAKARAFELLKPDFAGRVGFAAYELTNNNANIRRLYERIEQVGKQQATPASQEEGTKARFEDCPMENRVRLFFPGKPDAETRSRLKHNGFRWAPSLECWQAYRNWSSLRTARIEAGLPEKATVSQAEATEAFSGEIEREIAGEATTATASTGHWADQGAGKVNLAESFITEIENIAARSGKCPAEVYALWRKYADECRGADQSAILSEFMEWYKRDLTPACSTAADEQMAEGMSALGLA